MKAVVQDRFGPPEQVLRVTETDRPAPGPGEVLVRLRATTVNTPDWIAVAGVPYVLRASARAKGAIRGTDIAGTVAALGEGVTAFTEGEAVFGTKWGAGFTRAGTFAEYTVTAADQLLPKPAGLSFTDAACAVMSGLTARAAVAAAQAGPGTRLLVNGASGGVGTFAVQIAKHRGAHVTAVCGPANLDLVRGLGADAALDYTAADFTAGAERYDAILDNVLNHRPRRVLRALAPGGVYLPNSVGNTGGLLAGLAKMGAASLLGALGRARVATVDGNFTPERLAEVAGLITSGAVTPVIDRVYPLAETPAAVARMYSHRARGNLVITMDDDEAAPR
ncbi:NAD(P)-dependent alcohol dehydrogenase [Glycomyces terrestris]|uniref:NAD(P)-dependent alcohol dehydrogenase n=1 Tax=Glycomyces terrestris TaxID=2493553 RepID=A0A426UVH6_9ACTN|nr:NAD(P)-dependent alcohol dehydrogenase [Glycomyces terrestris]RRR98320.1 NAD(P)-dependent alcohol dehydrogenase [Glycomyces terrestris]